MTAGNEVSLMARCQRPRSLAQHVRGRAMGNSRASAQRSFSLSLSSFSPFSICASVTLSFAARSALRPSPLFLAFLFCLVTVGTNGKTADRCAYGTICPWPPWSGSGQFSGGYNNAIYRCAQDASTVSPFCGALQIQMHILLAHFLA